MKRIIEDRYTPYDIGELLELAERKPQELVERSENYYSAQVDFAALQIREGMPRCKFVLLCGPSASGKTTTAHKLRDRLIRQGVNARVISMDDFYLGMKSYPILPSGKPDMESVKALDLDLLNRCFDQLLETGETRMPIFDFATQSRTPDAVHIELGEDDVLIMEGIHALNPEVLRNIPRGNVFRIYASVRTKFISGDEVILKPKDIRLMRRMVRDHKFRNYPPISTLRQWVHVLEGERVNINPYRDDVDLKMDNTIDYEVCVWHSVLQANLDDSHRGEYEVYPEIKHIFDGLERFPSMDSRLIAQDSLLREFVGDTP